MTPEIRDIFLKYGDFLFDLEVIEEQEIAELVGVSTIGIRFDSALDLIMLQLIIGKEATKEEKEILHEPAVLEISGSLFKGIKIVIY